MSEKIVLIVSSMQSNPATIEAVMRLAEHIRKQGWIPVSKALERDFHVTKADVVAEVRAFEQAMIMRKAVDDVMFTHPEAIDLRPLVALARQYGYLELVAA